MKGRVVCGLVLLFGLAGGCGDDDKDGDNGDSCHTGCVATLAANCVNGPETQAECEAPCQKLSGPTAVCAPQYRALKDCAVGKEISCDADGLPAVEACAEQQGMYRACIETS